MTPTTRARRAVAAIALTFAAATSALAWAATHTPNDPGHTPTGTTSTAREGR